MISISNADRDKTVEYLRAYAALLQGDSERTVREINTRRMALNLAGRLERKPKLTTLSGPIKRQYAETK